MQKQYSSVNWVLIIFKTGSISFCVKAVYTTTIAFLFSFPLFSQYYLTGEVRDEKGKPLQNVKIKLFSKGEYPYYSGASGSFGIPTPLAVDTIYLSTEGYEPVKSAIKSSQFTVFNLKMTPAKSNSTRVTLSSKTRDLTFAPAAVFQPQDESYSATIENDFLSAAKYPETGYAVNVDRASYSNIRRFLNNDIRPPASAVRLEEMLNYFNFKPGTNSPPAETFGIQSQLTDCPWNSENQLLFIHLQARKINLEKSPPSNLVFLIDVSGSMDKADRLPLLISAFRLLVENLRPVDFVSIVTYGNSVDIMLQPTGGSKKQKIIDAIEGLVAGGSTPGEAGIKEAYMLAKKAFIVGGNNRVILATDGDFNVGETKEKELEELVNRERKSGIYLTCLGVGKGNYKDSKLEALAKKGNGNFAYLDNEREAEKVFVEEFAQTLYSVANNVFFNVRFNPSFVKSYRLIGFDNKEDAVADTSRQLEGGEVGSGHSLLSVFEITPLNKPRNPDNSLALNSIADLQLSYRLPGNMKNLYQNFKVENNYLSLNNADSNYRFATAVIMFGSILKKSAHSKNMTWEKVKETIAGSANPDNLLHTEFLAMVKKAELLITPRKRFFPFKLF